MENKTKGSRESQEDMRDQKKRYNQERTRKEDRQPNAPEVLRGKHKDLQGWVYTYDTSARAYQYTKTTEALAEWVKMNLAFWIDVWWILTTLKEPKKDKWRPEEPTKDAGKV